MKRILGVGAILAALLVTVFMGAGGAAGETARVSEGNTVNVVEAGLSDFSSGDVLYWVDLMKKKGINVNFNLIDSAATGLKTVIQGQSDVFVGSLPTAILAIVNADAPIHIIDGIDAASDYIIIGLPGDSLQNVSGKTMGIDTPGSAGHLSAEIGLQKKGVDPNSVKYVTIGGSSARLAAIL